MKKLITEKKTFKYSFILRTQINTYNILITEWVKNAYKTILIDDPSCGAEYCSPNYFPVGYGGYSVLSYAPAKPKILNETVDFCDAVNFHLKTLREVIHSDK